MPVLQSSPAVDARARAEAGAPRSYVIGSTAPPDPDKLLVGREVEQRLVEQAVDDGARQGRALLVTGEPGVGKSSLLRTASRRARERGFSVLEATGVESEEGLGFAGLQLLLRPLMSSARTLPAAQWTALATAFGIEEGPAPQPFLVGLAALNLLSDAAAARPVAMVVDDVQWLDAPTEEALAFLARRLGGDRVVMVAVLRTGHSSPMLRAGLETVALQGLDDDASRELLAGVAGHLQTLDREHVLRLASGNPLALVELPGSWHPDRATRALGSFLGDVVPAPVPLSARLEHAFATRLPELAATTRDALLVAALDAEDELAEVLRGASVLAGAPIDGTALEPGVRAGLLTFDQARVRFRHPLVRSAILQSESASRRQAACAALAEVLEDQPWRRMWYRAQATTGPDEGVADELETAHRENLRRGSVTAAISVLERSAQLTGISSRRGHRLLLAAELGFGLGEADLVGRLLGEAAGHALDELDRARLEWLRELPDDADLRSHRRVAELVDVARRAATSDVDLALNLLVAAAVRCHWGWPTSDVRDRVVAVVESLRGTEADPRHVAALAVAQPLLQAGRVAHLLSTARVGGRTDAEALALDGMAAFAGGDQPLAADLLRRAGTACRREGRLGLLTQVLALGSAASMDLGDWREAAADADEAHRLAAETRQATWRAGTTMTLARGHALRGEITVARRLAAGLENDAGARGNTCAGASALLARGFALLDERRQAEAYVVLRRLFDPDDPCCHERERMPGIMFLAEAGVRAGRREDARSVVAALEDTAQETPSPLLHVHLVYARAVLADDERAEAAYRSALDHDLARWPLVRARLELAHGSWLRRQRRPSDARAPLRSALETLEWIGAGTWLEQARAELRATGERAPVRGGTRPEPSWQDRLTAQELHIARLAGEGLSNREIGERLFMSHRTVGAHLRHVFPKLGITSRVQLAALVTQRR